LVLTQDGSTAITISIVTVSFNQRAYLQEAIESVVGQNYPSLEYIVVDPGSTDGSRELIEEYKDRIARVIFEKDRSAADGLNKGFSFATGDVFGFLNSDDILLPGSLLRVADFFRQHPECDMAFGNGYTLDGKGRKIRHIKARGYTLRRYFHSGARWLQQATFFRREAFLRSPRFNHMNRTCWDGELFINMRRLGAQVGYIDADLGGFRIHAESISGSGRSLASYREDCKRMFWDAYGREWGLADTIWKTLYRVEGLTIRGTRLLTRMNKRWTQ
jgi:glycosyltransferase involved in cell wall biosynthesis